MNRIPLMLTITLASGCGAKRWHVDPMSFETVQRVSEHRQEQRADTWAHIEDPTAAMAPFVRADDLTEDAHDGIADLHVHQMAKHGYDGRVTYGGPAPCDGRSHGLRSNLFWTLLRAPGLLNDPLISDLVPHCPTVDFPTSDGWAHEQYGYEDLHHAHEAGLDLIVNYAVSNVILCAVSEGYDASTEGSCADVPNVERQLQEMWRFDEQNDWYQIALDPVDAMHAIQNDRLAVVPGIEASDYAADSFRGGAMGADPDLARRERMYSLAGKWRRSPLPRRDHGTWTKSEWRTTHAMAERLQMRGAVSIFAAHEWPNALAGSAVQHVGLFSLGYWVLTHVGAVDKLSPATALAALAAGSAGHRLDRWPMTVELARDPYLQTEHPRSRLGLTPAGDAFMHAVRGTSMILDIGHVSERATYDMLTQLDDWGRPNMVISSHVTPRQTTFASTTDHEFTQGHDVLKALERYGRTAVGFRTTNTPTRLELPPSLELARKAEELPANCFQQEAAKLGQETEYQTCLRGGTPNECSHLSRLVCRGEETTRANQLTEYPPRVLAPGDAVSLSQSYAYLETFDFPLGFGTDMNGGAFQTSPRRILRETVVQGEFAYALESTMREEPVLSLHCPRIQPSDGPVVAGSCGPQLSEYNRGGVATIAELPYLAADLKCLRGAPEDVEACRVALMAPTEPQDVCEGDFADKRLCRSAPDFVRSWAGVDVSYRTEETNETNTPAVPEPTEYNFFTLLTLNSTASANTTNSPSVSPSRGGSGRYVDGVRMNHRTPSGFSIINPGGPAVVTDREQARLYLRKLRKGGLSGGCETARELQGDDGAN